MNESTARAERFDIQTAASPSYLWEVPQKPVSVRFPFSLIDRLEHEAVENFRSLTSRGSEIGGLLVGDVAPGNPLVLSIADFDLIPCDYSRGPLYRLSDADIGRFEHAIQQRLAAGRGVAGFFRSHTRKGVSLDTDDLTFFQGRFRDPHQVALLIRPFATKASTAGLFIWENGKVNGESSYLEFPFRSSELGVGQAPEAPDPKPAAPPPAPPSTPKSSARAQIVPIASRREISLAPPPAAEPPAPPAPLVPPPPAPVAAVTPSAPVVEDKPAIVPDKPSKAERPAKHDRNEKPARNAKVDAPAVKVEPAAAKVEPPAPKADSTFPKGEPPIPPFGAPAESPLEESLPPVTAPDFGAASEPGSGKGVKLIAAAAGSIAVFVALFVYPGLLRNNPKAPVPVHQDSSQLQLRVERARGELLLTWNRDSDAIRNASKAILDITDGTQHENVQMDLAQLAIGSIMYSPSGTDISFKMEVIDKAQKTTTSESVRMLRPPSPLQEQNDPAAKTPAATTAAKPVPGAAPQGASPAEPEVAEQPAKPAPTPLKPFKTESLSQRLRPAASTDMPDAPTLSSSAHATTIAIPGVNVNAMAPAPPAPTQPVGASGPDNKVKAGGNIQQAVLIYRKDAEYPKIAKQTGAKGTVTLNATIGIDGSIKKVKVISGHPMLTSAAVEAVKQWRYRPTLLNGQPVEADTQVLVNFVGDR